MNVNNTNKKLYRLEDKKKAQPHTTCSACEKPVETWDQYGESQTDYGMMIWECCPHCGEASNDNTGVDHGWNCCTRISNTILHSTNVG